MKLLLILISMFLISCGIEESIDNAIEENFNDSTGEPYNAEITGNWKVDSTLTSSSCDQFMIGEETSKIMSITTDVNGRLYDNGVFLENTSYTDGKYRFDGPYENGTLKVYVNFSDNNTGDGFSEFTKIQLEPTFGWFEVDLCTVIRSVKFTRL